MSPTAELYWGEALVWNAKELPISNVTEATDLVLPRFQRKSTWNARKDFLLALSFFRGLPLGTIVIKEAEAEAGPASQRYLLDGRQRWEALKGIHYPETVYQWAKAAIGIRPKWSEELVTKAFLGAIDNFFGADPTEEEIGQDFLNEPDEELESIEEMAEADATEPPPLASVTGNTGLDELLEILLLVHPLTSKGSRLTKAFAIHDLFPGVPYTDSHIAGGTRVNARKLQKWITFQRKISAKPVASQSPDDVYTWITAGSSVEPATEAALRDRIKKEWGTIVTAVRLNEQIEKRLEQTPIAALILTGTTASEDAKIFEIINTGGTKLTAAEVLSAAPQWRAEIANPNQALLTDARDLYDAMGVEVVDGAARWDVPATLLSRLRAPGVLGDLTGPTPRGDTRRFERRITLGFQLVAGWYAGKIAKDHVETLPKTHKSIDWSTTLLEDTFNGALKYACTQEQFQYWDAWAFSVIALMSDAVALNFVLSMAIDWDRKGRPTVDGADLKTLRRNARTLLDRSVYEYCIGQWRGSSDSKIANNIAALRAGEQAAFDPVLPEDWNRLVNEVVNEGTILGVDYTQQLDNRIKLLACYRAVVKRQWVVPGPKKSYEFDHIVPSSEFAQEPAGSAKRKLEHHIVNIGVLPGKLNNGKSDKKLSDIDSMADKEELSRLEDVPLALFDRISGPEGALALRSHRGPIILEDLTTLRELRLAQATAT